MYVQRTKRFTSVAVNTVKTCSDRSETALDQLSIIKNPYIDTKNVKIGAFLAKLEVGPRDGGRYRKGGFQLGYSGRNIRTPRF